MTEVIATVIGVLLGALTTWLFNRSRPHYIICEDSFRARISIGGKPWAWSASWYTGKQDSISFDLGLPQTKIYFNDQAVDMLNVIRLKFRNSGDKLIAHPNLVIKLGESATILGCDLHIEPEQYDVVALHERIQSQPAGSSRDLSPTLVDPNKVAVTLESLYPHNISQEMVVVDIFCAGEIDNPEIHGRGTFPDGSVWATKFEPWRESQKRIQRRVNLFNGANLVGLLAVFIGYMIWRRPSGLVTIHPSALAAWASHPLFLILIVWLVLLLGYAFYMGLRGWSLSLPMPFLKRRLVIFFWRKRDKSAK